MKYKDTLQTEIDNALITLDLACIRRCEKIYTDELSRYRIAECIKEVRHQTQLAIKRADDMTMDLFGYRINADGGPKGAKILPFPEKDN
ncbi:MAG: hypothetical protein PQJ50_09920 [Spirochaetales bacterium]|nr:hypothetical protein [Spirochaetales bacterium]